MIKYVYGCFNLYLYKTNVRIRIKQIKEGIRLISNWWIWCKWWVLNCFIHCQKINRLTSPKNFVIILVVWYFEIDSMVIKNQQLIWYANIILATLFLPWLTYGSRHENWKWMKLNFKVRITVFRDYARIPRNKLCDRRPT